MGRSGENALSWSMGKSHWVACVCGCLLVLFFRWDWGVVVWGRLALWLVRGMGDVCCSGMEEDSTPSEERWGYFGLNLAYGQSV